MSLSGTASKRARKAFFALYGALPPWSCYFCHKAIWFDRGSSASSLHVHHLDEDHDNNSDDNIVPSHGGCHLRHHWDVRHKRELACLS